MDPVTIAAATAVATYLAEKIANTSFETVIEVFTEDGIKWLRSIFQKKDGSPTNELKNLQEDPQNAFTREVAIMELRKQAQRSKEDESILHKLAQKLKDEVPGPWTQIIGDNSHGNIQIGGITSKVTEIKIKKINE